jgi:hypothetical protein
MNQARLALAAAVAAFVLITPAVASAADPHLKTRHETTKNSIGNIR